MVSLTYEVRKTQKILYISTYIVCFLAINNVSLHIWSGGKEADELFKLNSPKVFQYVTG